MRDEWCGHNRDLVKWDALIHLAQRGQRSTILHVARYRLDDDRSLLYSSRGYVDIPTPVLRDFRDLDTIQRLAKPSGVEI